MTKILVTGSKGFIGKQVIEHLKDNDVIPDSVGSKRIDLKNIEEVMAIKKSDIVVHLGGKTIKNLDWKITPELYRFNVSMPLR